MCTQGYVRLRLVLGRHPKINLFVLHYCVTCCEVETKYRYYQDNIDNDITIAVPTEIRSRVI